MVEDRTLELLINELRALRLRVTQVEAQLQDQREQEQQSNEILRSPTNDFAKGDRVRVTNRVRRPATWPADWTDEDVEKERNATVTHRVRDQIWLITDNGTKTWRAQNNLNRIE